MSRRSSHSSEENKITFVYDKAKINAKTKKWFSKSIINITPFEEFNDEQKESFNKITNKDVNEFLHDKKK
jgi:hypothetical protein